MTNFKKTFLLSMICLIGLTTSVQALTTMEIKEYRIQMFTDPDPLIAKKSSIITFKILRIKDLTPVVARQIRVTLNKISDESHENNAAKISLPEIIQKGQTDIFGNFEFKTTFKNKGDFQVTAELFSPETNSMDKKIKMGFTLKVKPSENSGLRLAFILFLLFGMTGAGIFIIKLKVRTPITIKINLLDVSIVKQIFLSRFFQPFVQMIFLVFLFMLIFLALFDIQDSSRNLSAILVWTIWWAGVIFTFVLAGRLWCFMCPVGAISEWVSNLFEPHRVLPKSLQNMWLANIFFILLTWLDIQIGVVRNPMVTGLLLTFIIVVAAVIGSIYQRRTFCRYLCPIGGIIGIYSLFAPIELRAKDLDVCKHHKRKDCYLGNEKGRGCPMFELVPKMDNNKTCNFCGECIKSCPKDNISIRFRPFFKDAWETKHLSWDDTVFTMVLLGVTIFVTGDMLEPWSAWIQSAMKWFPTGFLGIHYQYTIEVVTKSVLYFFISLVFIPGLILLSAKVSDHMVKRENRIGLKQTMITFGIMFIPVALSMHLAHNTGHLLNESLKIIPALQRTVIKYLPFNVGKPDWQIASASLVDPLFLYWMQMILFLSFFGFSLMAGYKLAIKNYNNSQVAFRALLPMVCIAAILMAINVYLLNLPMAPRHIH